MIFGGIVSLRSPAIRAWRTPGRMLALFIGAVLLVTGCQQDLAGGAACPSLCPDTLTIRDTILPAMAALDTEATVYAPPIGAESQLLVANYTQGGQPVQTIAVLRFDSLQRIYPDTDTTAPIRPFNRVDSTSLVVQAIAADTDTTFVKDTAVTFLVYDVDTAATDLDTAAVRAKFLAATPIASRTVKRDSLDRGVSIPLDTTFVRDHVLQGKRIRLAISVTTPNHKNARVEITSTEGGNSSVLHYMGFADSLSFFASILTNTHAPAGPNVPSLADYVLVLQGSPPPPPGILAAGGIPATRVFFRFTIPPQLIDSSTSIVRASLELHQVGNPNFTSADTLRLITSIVRATPAVSDITTAAMLSELPTALSINTPLPVLIAPTATQTDTIALVGIFNLWKTEGVGKTQRAIVLESSGGGLDPRQYYFYSAAAPVDSLRPRLHISYIPRSSFGLP